MRDFVKKLRKSNLDVTTVTKINNLFISKNWKELDNKNEVFDRFCRTFELLNIEQRNLILELIDKYVWIHFNNYANYVTELFLKLGVKFYAKSTKVYILPLNFHDEKYKSGNLIGCLIRSSIFNNNSNFNYVSFEVVDSLENLLEIYDNISPIIVIDDFIGTSESIKKTITTLLIKFSKFKEMIKVLAIVGMNHGIEVISKLGVEVIVSIKVCKGIGDCYKEPELAINYKIMDTIEKHIKNISFYRYGYKMSEALVTMSRTPDNTFPIFWKEIVKEKDIYLAPFQRESYEGN